MKILKRDFFLSSLIISSIFSILVIKNKKGIKNIQELMKICLTSSLIGSIMGMGIAIAFANLIWFARALTFKKYSKEAINEYNNINRFC